MLDGRSNSLKYFCRKKNGISNIYSRRLEFIQGDRAKRRGRGNMFTGFRFNKTGRVQCHRCLVTRYRSILPIPGFFFTIMENRGYETGRKTRYKDIEPFRVVIRTSPATFVTLLDSFRVKLRERGGGERVRPFIFLDDTTPLSLSLCFSLSFIDNLIRYMTYSWTEL